MQLYNSLTRTKDEFITNVPHKVNMYTCGPTVYHFAHIGNLRSYIMEDVLEKYLRYAGYDVKRVMNITDVGHLSSDADTGEDKMLKGAKREHKTVMEIAKFYTDAFFTDCAALNIKTPDVVEPATNCIPEFITMVQGLLDKGYAYVAGGNGYFDTSQLDKYYVFGDHEEENLAVGVREGVEADDNKRNKTDFVLWFTKSKFEDQELKWESPWGMGYPGWHIECSAISLKHLGEYMDLHCGGIDNAFPHHTNEIAQSESYLGHKWCNHWFHVHHLNTTGGKMSKSKGEFLTVSLLKEKGYNPLAYRLFCLQSHYRRGLMFSWENLDNAQTAYDKLVSRIAALKAGEPEAQDAEAMEALRSTFKEAMDNDLATSLAVTALYDVLKAKISDGAKRLLIGEFDTVLSLGLLEAAQAKAEETAAPQEGDAEIDALVAARTEAKKARNFAEADRIRDLLKDMGIVLVDTKEGTTWHR
ncbi:MAG: cysteine--tRNA ligase [Oscillospiraceae bacterium]|nr:cysteine--tRNA ligase [Oscillospiraceae bacterium]